MSKAAQTGGIERKPWWTGKFPALGTGLPEADWAAQAMVQHAFVTGGGPVYDHSFSGVLKGEGTFKELVERLKALGLRPVYAIPGKSDAWRKYILAREDACLDLHINDGDVRGQLATTDETLYEGARKLLEERVGPRAGCGRAYVMINSGMAGHQLESIGVAAAPLERANYNPDVLADYDHVVRDLKSSAPTGRLAILDGPPGTGKTYAIRGLIDACPDAIFVFVPVQFVTALVSPDLIGTLVRAKQNKGTAPLVFVIEDADNCLGKRNADNVNHVSSLLNLGDGVIGSMLDVRVVCTTNLRDEELDAAVIRPGRLSRRVTIGKLKREVAEALYARLTGNPIRFSVEPTLAEVYGMATGAGWKPPVAPRAVGFTADLSANIHAEFCGAIWGAGAEIRKEGT